MSIVKVGNLFVSYAGVYDNDRHYLLLPREQATLFIDHCAINIMKRINCDPTKHAEVIHV